MHRGSRTANDITVFDWIARACGICCVEQKEGIKVREAKQQQGCPRIYSGVVEDGAFICLADMMRPSGAIRQGSGGE